MKNTQKNYTCGHKDECCGYVTKKVAKRNRKEFFEHIKVVQQKMKEKGYPGFCFSLVGSARRNMVYVTRNENNIYDQDIQFIYTNNKNKISDRTYKNKIRNDLVEAFYKVLGDGWKVENSKSAITIKHIRDHKIIASFDVALIDLRNKKLHKFDKENNVGIWNDLSTLNKSGILLETKNSKQLKDEYLKLKHNKRHITNKNDDEYVPSCMLYVEAINNVNNQNKQKSK